MVLVEVIESPNGNNPWILSKENTSSVETNKFEVAAVWIRARAETDVRQVITKGDDYHWEKEYDNQKKSKPQRSDVREKMRESVEKETNAKAKQKAKPEKNKTRYTTDNELVVSGNTPIMKALAETQESRRNAGKIIELIESSQAWGGMKIGQGEDDVKAEAPNTKADGAEAETETKLSEEHVNLERKRREELRYIEKYKWKRWTRCRKSKRTNSFGQRKSLYLKLWR